jgi:glyoxylase-like metal-dependent hydrolase (beta-lactamase superfamily II)
MRDFHTFMSTPSTFFQTLPHGLRVIDTGFERASFDAAYLIVENGRAAFIDTGTNDSVPRLLATLEQNGVAPDAVDWVIATHVHLDHAGGVGLLMQQLPHARLLVHPQGRPHLIKPRLLSQSAQAVYGEEASARLYGQIVPVPAARTLASEDGMRIDLAGRELQILHTPGHAAHHHCVFDARSGTVFTGDTFGLSYREFDSAAGPWLLPTTTPVQFDPPRLHESIARIAALPATRIALTHYGPVEGDIAVFAASLHEQVDEMVALAESLRSAHDRHDALKQALAARYVQRARAHGCTLAKADILDLLALDIELNAQGLGVWLAGPPPALGGRS